MKSKNVPWTEEELQVVRTGWEAGDKPADISERLPHRKPTSIAAAASRYKFKRNRNISVEVVSYDIMERSMREQDRAYVQALLKAGYTMTQSGTQINSSGSTR